MAIDGWWPLCHHRGMTVQRVRQGFTLIELLIVIIVITILVMLTATIYQNSQAQARDVQIAAAADKVADAMTLYLHQEKSYPLGSAFSSSVANTTGCTNGFGVGWFSKGNDVCNVEESLVARSYLPSGFSDSLPSNPLYAAPNKRALMIQKYASNRFMVFYSMDQPTASDTSHFNAELTKCGVNPAGSVPERDANGMKNGICIEYVF